MFQLAIRLGSGSFNDIGAGESLNKNFLGSLYTGSDWYNLINIRHRNGNSDGVGFGMQIRSPMTTVYPDLEIRQQNNASWGGWFDIPIYTVLFSDSTGRTDSIAISVSAANFEYMEIYFMLTVKEATYHFCEKVCDPNGKTVGYSFNRPANASASGNLQIQLFAGRLTISGTAVSRNFESFVTIDGTTQQIISSNYTARNIRITKILGYR